MTINKKKVRGACLCVSLFALAQTVFAAPTSSAIHTPKPGSAERKAILNALRKPIARFNRKSVIFTAVDLKVAGRWAYVQAASVDAKGKRVGPPFTNEVSALLRKGKSAWSVAEWAYATDVISLEWEKKHPEVPKKLWPHRR